MFGFFPPDAGWFWAVAIPADRKIIQDTAKAAQSRDRKAYDIC
jgi:hypothetical protein